MNRQGIRRIATRIVPPLSLIVLAACNGNDVGKDIGNGISRGISEGIKGFFLYMANAMLIVLVLSIVASIAIGGGLAALVALCRRFVRALRGGKPVAPPVAAVASAHTSPPHGGVFALLAGVALVASTAQLAVGPFLSRSHARVDAGAAILFSAGVYVLARRRRSRAAS